MSVCRSVCLSVISSFTSHAPIRKAMSGRKIVLCIRDCRSNFTCREFLSEESICQGILLKLRKS